MMPQPPQQRPARMPSGPSPAMGGGMPNRADQLRQQAEQTLPSMSPMGGGRPPMGGGAPAGGIAALIGGGTKKSPMEGAPPLIGTPPPMGNAPMGMGMGMGNAENDGPGEQDLVLGIAMTANEIAGGEPRRAIAMLDQAKQILMQNLGEEDGAGAGEPDMGRLAEILGGGGGGMMA